MNFEKKNRSEIRIAKNKLNFITWHRLFVGENVQLIVKSYSVQANYLNFAHLIFKNFFSRSLLWNNFIKNKSKVLK